jgi:hypothetical protein
MDTVIEPLREHAKKIERSGALGRSRSYVRLLEFLVECSLQGRTPKELEIAMEVFGKGPNFDPSQDSMVRVYAHNLRQKLDHYYAGEGRGEREQLALARGEYRVALVPVEGAPDKAAETPAAPPEPAPVASLAVAEVPAVTLAPAPLEAAGVTPAAARAREPRTRLALIAASVLVLGILIGIAVGSARVPTPSAAQSVASSPLWSPLFDDSLPILVVVGDYYIFGELNPDGEVDRLVRNFAVNSSKDLDELMMYQPALQGRYLDLDLTYLPRGSAFALLDVLRVLYTSDKSVRVVSMSELNIADLKSNHIVYLGYLSALDKLEEFVFASSGLAVGYTYDELHDTETGDTYTSEGGIPEEHRNYRDYGLVSTFPGPAGNQFMIIAGTRDAGMMQAAHEVSDPMFVKRIEQARPDGGSAAPSFEMLYEVTGYARTNLDAKLVHTSKLNYSEIWGGTDLHGQLSQ